MQGSIVRVHQVVFALPQSLTRSVSQLVPSAGFVAVGKAIRFLSARHLCLGLSDKQAT